MEEKKFDLNAVIGFTLIFGILMFMLNKNISNDKIVKKPKTEQIIPQTIKAPTDSKVLDSTQIKANKVALGNFAYSTATTGFTTISNAVLELKIANKGGYIVEAKLKQHEQFKKNSKQIVELIKDNNSNLNLSLHTNDNRVLNTKDLFFEPTVSKVGDKTILTMRLKSGENEFLEYKYSLGTDYMIGFDIHSQGLNKTLNTSKPLDLEWNLKAFRNEKSITYENRYTEIYFEKEDEKIDYVGQGVNKEENPEKMTFVAFKQHFFSTILISKTPIEKAKLISNNLVIDEDKDTIFTKQFKANLPLAFKNGEINYEMQLYFGPTDYKTLQAYNQNLEKTISLGWGIIGWINRFIFIPLFGFFSSTFAYGIAIIIFTFFIKLVMSPITYKSFLSQAKMKVLRPEIAELGEKFGKDPMKKQQETMKLYNKAGVNPMAGCIPALIQMPFLMASFQFFPAVFDLRQKSFLWADDLSSFDQIAKLPFRIPMYGDHIALFPILAAIAIFFYMKMTSGDQAMAQPQQEGMPDMAKMMKIMIYISPIMMLIFFNSYGAGLSLYNFMSNLITIGIMVVIKKYVVDEKKIHAQIEVNRTKEPKKLGKFQQKLQDVMKEAEAQKAAQAKKK
jgi:YidC/Oxa1 family membrane protein insertase